MSTDESSMTEAEFLAARRARPTFTRRRFDPADDATPPALPQRCADPAAWPTKAQWRAWGRYVDVEGFPKPDGEGWWYALCPVSDPTASGSRPTAMINFRVGSMRCLHDEPCHERRSVSLANVAARVADSLKAAYDSAR